MPVRNLIGRLWWLALMSRPDIYCALHKCATHQNKPSQKLWKHLICILKYLKTTETLGLVFQRSDTHTILGGMCDASFATEVDSKSRFGYFFFCLGGLVSWVSQHSTRVMTSSTEAECHALVHTGKENIWEREFLTELKLFPHIPPTPIYQDNKSAITLATGGTHHKRSKHFGIEFDALRGKIR